MPHISADAQHYTILVAAIVAVAAACAGYDRGWALGHDKQFTPGGKSAYKPSFDLQVSVGWWNATTTMTTAYFPTALQFNSDAAKGLGAFTCIVLGLSGLVALLLLATAFMDRPLYPSALTLRGVTETSVMWGFSGLILLVSLALYGSLAYGADQELKKDLDAGLFCWPDWAFAFALLAAGCWAALAKTTSDRQQQGHGYMPI